MTDYNTSELDRHQGIVDQTADEDAAMERNQEEFSKRLMHEYLDDNHKLSWLVADWLSEEGTQMEGYLFSVITSPDFDMGQVWRDWLTDKFSTLAVSMDSKEIDDFVEEYF
jgi:hypothetical protein